MSRTLHVDLTPSRRSRRLLKNGYYLQPSGEQTQFNEYSSEDEDDNASIHSNNSSIYSERAVHYNESPAAPFLSHKRRKRKGLESPHLGALSARVKSQSIFIKEKSQPAGASPRTRSNPDLSVTRQERDRSQTSRETKTTVHSTKRTHQSHRYARGESSSLIQTSFSAGQTPGRNLTSDISSSPAQNRESIMTRHQSRYEAFGGGDQTPIMSSLRNEMNHSQVYSTPREVLADTDEAATGLAHQNIRQSKLHSHLSSKSGMETEEKGNIEFMFVPFLLSKLSDVLRLFVACISLWLEYICSRIYKTMLRIFVFDIWWLTRRTSPLLVKVARYLLILLVLFLLLTSAYLFAARLMSRTTETVSLPVQSNAGIFHTISQAFASIAILSGAGTEEDEIAYKSVIKKVQETASPYLKSYLDVEELLVKTELGFADKLLEIRNEMIAMRNEQLRFNEKQQRIELRITDASDQQNAADTAIREKFLALEDAISTMRINHTSTGQGLKVDIEQLRELLAEKSQASLKINEFNTQLRAFDARLNMLNELMMKSIQDVDKHVGNTTFIKEIAKMQFIENFLQILKTTEGSTEHKNSLNFLLIAWLKRQGFARVDEVERSIKNTAVNHNLTLAVLERKFTTQFETIKHEAKRDSSAITLEKIVERPLKEEEPTRIGMEAAMKKWIRDELAIYSADRIGLADHALESAGGFIVSTRCSESYNRKTALISLFGMPIYYNINTPRSVLQANTLPGECWSFKGAEGYVVIALSGAVRPTSFTLEHIPRELSPYGRIDSAPKEFVVLGLSDVYDYEGEVLGNYRYEQVGPVIQQFSVTTPTVDYFAYIELRVTSNWGHPEYTCLYRFRVHGNRQLAKTPPI